MFDVSNFCRVEKGNNPTSTFTDAFLFVFAKHLSASQKVTMLKYRDMSSSAVYPMSSEHAVTKKM